MEAGLAFAVAASAVAASGKLESRPRHTSPTASSDQPKPMLAFAVDYSDQACTSIDFIEVSCFCRTLQIAPKWHRCHIYRLRV